LTRSVYKQAKHKVKIKNRSGILDIKSLGGLLRLRENE